MIQPPKQLKITKQKKYNDEMGKYLTDFNCYKKKLNEEKNNGTLSPLFEKTLRKLINVLKELNIRANSTDDDEKEVSKIYLDKIPSLVAIVRSFTVYFEFKKLNMPSSSVVKDNINELLDGTKQKENKDVIDDTKSDNSEINDNSNICNQLLQHTPISTENADPHIQQPISKVKDILENPNINFNEETTKTNNTDIEDEKDISKQNIDDFNVKPNKKENIVYNNRTAANTIINNMLISPIPSNSVIKNNTNEEIESEDEAEINREKMEAKKAMIEEIISTFKNAVKYDDEARVSISGTQNQRDLIENAITYYNRGIELYNIVKATNPKTLEEAQIVEAVSTKLNMYNDAIESLNKKLSNNFSL